MKNEEHTQLMYKLLFFKYIYFFKPSRDRLICAQQGLCGLYGAVVLLGSDMKMLNYIQNEHRNNVNSVPPTSSVSVVVSV